VLVATSLEQLATLCSKPKNRHAMSIGVIEAVLNAMALHLKDVPVQRWGCALCCSATKGTDIIAFECKQRAADAGATKSIVSALEMHPENLHTQICGVAALANIVVGDDHLSFERAHLATTHGAIESTVAVMLAHGDDELVIYYGQHLLSRLCRSRSGFDPEAKAEQARKAGAREEWLSAPPRDHRDQLLIDHWEVSARVESLPHVPSNVVSVKSPQARAAQSDTQQASQQA